MLIGRDLATLSPKVAKDAAFALDTNTFVGKGAVEVLHRCTQGGDDEERLVALHKKLVPLLVSPVLYAPAYSVSHTEDQCCELRRWEVREQEKRGRKRRRMASTVDSQLLRQSRLKFHSGKLGFKKRLSPPAVVCNIAVVHARALLRPLQQRSGSKLRTVAATSGRRSSQRSV